MTITIKVKFQKHQSFDLFSVFSSWFFYWVLKSQRIFSSAIGLKGLPKFPYASEQSFGAYIAIIIAVLWWGKDHFYQIVINLIHPSKNHTDRADGISNRVAVFGIFIGFSFLCFFVIKSKFL